MIKQTVLMYEVGKVGGGERKAQRKVNGLLTMRSVRCDLRDEYRRLTRDP